MNKIKSLRPLIGIVPDFKEGCPSSYSVKNFYALRANYVEMINKAGGAALILTYDYDLIDSYIEALDGIVIVGGYFDIHPKYYGEKEIHPTMKLNDARNDFEIALGLRVVNTKMPYLGICNGMQLLNVLHGGKVIQHILDEEKFMDHEQSHFEGFKDYCTAYHDVEIVENSKLFSVIGAKKIKTNSSHHQATKNPGEGLKIAGYASDGIIEALEKVDHPFCVGVQWHPEFDTSGADRRIFENFIEAAKKYKMEK
ncbi:MAG: gamma-glutamyl-gamma-aminobutyrate hydrolase family protein [Pelagibacterales bacterium]|nr:gamma-glutamyl-gamma-aminobutyrate hydrolase family protein [Pelagibacterales bacterium]